MKIISLIAASAFALISDSSHWTLDRAGVSAALSDARLLDIPLRLSCAVDSPYLQIEIFAGPANSPSDGVTLVGPSNIRLSLQGRMSPGGRLISTVYFKSLTVAFLREEGEVEVLGEKPYRINLYGARRVVDALQSSCLPVT